MKIKLVKNILLNKKFKWIAIEIILKKYTYEHTIFFPYRLIKNHFKKNCIIENYEEVIECIIESWDNIKDERIYSTSFTYCDLK